MSLYFFFDKLLILSLMLETHDIVVLLFRSNEREDLCYDVTSLQLFQ